MRILILFSVALANNFSDSRCRCLCPPLKSISDKAEVYFGSDDAEATTCTSEKVVRPAIGNMEVSHKKFIFEILFPKNVRKKMRFLPEFYQYF